MTVQPALIYSAAVLRLIDAAAPRWRPWLPGQSGLPLLSRPRRGCRPGTQPGTPTAGAR